VGENIVKIRSRRDHVLIQCVEAERQTSGGVILPDAAKGKPNTGQFIAVGKGRMLANGSHRKKEE